MTWPVVCTFTVLSFIDKLFLNVNEHLLEFFIFSAGPDICGPGTKKVHAIINYKGKNLLINKDIRCKDDVYTHLYTFIIKPDNTYEVRHISWEKKFFNE